MPAYQLIEKIPQNYVALEDPELTALKQVWKEHKEKLDQTGEFKEFLKRLQREWAIETGIIERLYQWDRGVTEVLIEQGIEAATIAHQSGFKEEKARQVTALIKDQESVVKGLFDFVKEETPLTEHYIRSLHSEFTCHQEVTEALTAAGERVWVDLIRGAYKRQPNNPRRADGEMHAYCPPELVTDEMQRLVQWYNEHPGDVSAEVLAAWLHHRFTQIHPFQDGNGRMARALASLVFIKEGLFPLVIRGDDKERQSYIEALEQADQGDLRALAELFASKQRRSVLKALNIGQAVSEAQFGEAIAQAAIAALRRKYEGVAQDIQALTEVAESLRQKTQGRLEGLAETLKNQLGEITPPLGERPFTAVVDVSREDVSNDRYFYNQILAIAAKFDYFANLKAYRAWVRVKIHTESHFELVFSIHGYGPQNSGVMAVSAFTEQRVPREEGGADLLDLKPACVDLFQFNYAEAREHIGKRFDPWLESSIAIAMNHWSQLVG